MSSVGMRHELICSLFDWVAHFEITLYKYIFLHVVEKCEQNSLFSLIHPCEKNYALYTELWLEKLICKFFHWWKMSENQLFFVYFSGENNYRIRNHSNTILHTNHTYLYRYQNVKEEATIFFSVEHDLKKKYTPVFKKAMNVW